MLPVILIAVSMVLSAVSLVLHKAGKEKAATMVDRIEALEQALAAALPK